MVENKAGAACAMLMLCVMASGCGTEEREMEASAVAEGFLAALEREDADVACASLAPETLEALVLSEGLACEKAITEQDLPGGSVDEVVVWGDHAQARTEADVLFLSELGDGWKVVAAGCRPQGERPYRCEVGGS